LTQAGREEASTRNVAAQKTACLCAHVIFTAVTKDEPRHAAVTPPGHLAPELACQRVPMLIGQAFLLDQRLHTTERVRRIPQRAQPRVLQEHPI
jgi:hypothetical protein